MLLGSMAIEARAIARGTTSTATKEMPSGKGEGTPFATARLRAMEATAFRIMRTALDGSTNR
jgi:hypothetical protein